MGIEPVKLLENRELHRLLVESAQRRFIAHGICDSGPIVHWTLRVGTPKTKESGRRTQADRNGSRESRTAFVTFRVIRI